MTKFEVVLTVLFIAMTSLILAVTIIMCMMVGCKDGCMGMDFDFNCIKCNCRNDYDGAYASRHDVTKIVNI